MYIRILLWLCLFIAVSFAGSASSSAGVLLGAAQDPPQNGWSALSFLMGEWVGEGSGKPGQGSGAFSFTTDLQGKVLIRKNYAEYPATKDRPAFRHDDLMLVYREEQGNQLHAIYFDSENHTINYGVRAVDSNTAEFLSEANPATPRYRLTYHKTSSDTIAIKFEIAPPGKPDSFATYIEAVCRRKPANTR